jgi:hypothetical protein
MHSSLTQANPDQSKHLETANLRVLGYEIDCVNLRAETYTDTRIPEIRKGTALEDALRRYTWFTRTAFCSASDLSSGLLCHRDFTMNALFYNLNTKEVEDLTQRGLSDLATGMLTSEDIILKAYLPTCVFPLPCRHSTDPDLSACHLPRRPTPGTVCLLALAPRSCVTQMYVDSFRCCALSDLRRDSTSLWTPSSSTQPPALRCARPSTTRSAGSGSTRNARAA